MKFICKISTILSITTSLNAQDSASKEVIDITGDYQEAPHQEEIIDVTGVDQEAPLPRLTISNLINTRLSEKQKSSIEGFLSLPYWADNADLFKFGLDLINNLPKKERYILISDIIRQKIERIKANEPTQTPPRKRKRVH